MKKILLAFILCACVAGIARADSVFVLPRSVNVIYFFPSQGAGVPAEQWTEVDATALGIPADATAVFIQGIMAITGGQTPEWCGMYILITPNQTYDFANLIALHDPANPSVILPAFGLGEAVAAPSGAVREPFATWVPLVNGKFFYIWTRGTQGEYPEHCSYGANMVIQSYTR